MRKAHLDLNEAFPPEARDEGLLSLLLPSQLNQKIWGSRNDRIRDQDWADAWWETIIAAHEVLTEKDK